jgi:hypothetical protein
MFLKDHVSRQGIRGSAKYFNLEIVTEHGAPAGSPAYSELPSSIFIRVDAPWVLTCLESSTPDVQPRNLPAGIYRLSFTPNSPGALSELIIDPDPGPGGNVG